MTWTSDCGRVTLYQGDCLTVLPTLEAGSVHCVVTSPPYWGLRDYGTAKWEGGDAGCDHKVDTSHQKQGSTSQRAGRSNVEAQRNENFRDICGKCGARRIDNQLGLEPTPEEYVAKVVAIFREVWRVLRDDGTLWLNLGDSYANDSKWGGSSGGKHVAALHGKSSIGRTKVQTGLKPKDLVGIPWRVAFALQADGWYLRQDIIWCLSGGTWLYARTQKGDMPIMVRDLMRLKPDTVQLWNGEKWTSLLGMNKSNRRGNELEIVLRSGERISCTPTHRFPTNRGLLEASAIRTGDILQRCRLPQPEHSRDCVIDEDAAWFAGLYLAEGSRSSDKIQIAGHAKEMDRWIRVRRIAAKFGGSATIAEDGNNQLIRVYGKLLNAIVDELVAGRTSRDKGFSPVVWRYSNRFIEAMVDGYLSGDGHEDGNRWRLGFCRNYNLERDLRTASARLGWQLTLNTSTVRYDGRDAPTFRGEIRKEISGHGNCKDRNEVVEIRKARCREVYDLGVADEPHLFSLASGILTHNSKPSPMPESVRDRCTKAHEYLFLLTKRPRYFYNAEAVKEGSVDPESLNGIRKRYNFGHGDHDPTGFGRTAAGFRNMTEEKVYPARNRRSVWTIPSKPFIGWHKTVHWEHVGPDDACDGMKRIESANCPVHGCLDRQGGEREACDPSHTSSNSDCLAQASHDGPASSSTHHDSQTTENNSDCSDPGHESSASFRNTQTSKTAPAPATTPSCTPSVETGSRTECTPVEQVSSEHRRGTSENNTSGADCGDSQSNQIPDGNSDRCSEMGVSLASFTSYLENGCKCSFYRKTTKETSHFATFPPKLIEPCIQAGTSEEGCCPTCGAPWERVVERMKYEPPTGTRFVDESRGDKTCKLSGKQYNDTVKVVGQSWQPTCDCGGDPVPCTVMDPFGGSGTTALVALQHGRNVALIELSEEYAAMARRRIKRELAQRRLFV